jgi:hypothetical protein
MEKKFLNILNNKLLPIKKGTSFGFTFLLNVFILFFIVTAFYIYLPSKPLFFIFFSLGTGIFIIIRGRNLSALGVKLLIGLTFALGIF